MTPQNSSKDTEEARNRKQHRILCLVYLLTAAGILLPVVLFLVFGLER